MSSLPEITGEVYRKMMDTAFEINMCGTWIGLNDKGQVEVRVLTVGELLDLKAKYNDFKDLPAEYKVYTEKDLQK